MNKSMSSAIHWFAIKTKYKTEKYVVDQLKRKGIEAYVPLIQVTKRYDRKIKKLDLPLIHCYAFVHIELAEKIKVLQTEHVFSFVGQGGKMESIPEEEINLLKRIVGEYEGAINASSLDWQPGTPVEIVSGSLTGISGKLVSKSGKNNFIVELSSIGVQLHMEIDKKLLRKQKRVA